MSREQSPGSDAMPPHAQLIQMGTGSWVSAIVYAAAKLGLADHLAAGPKSAAELAGATATHAPSLHRLMRTLASLGILTERDAQRFALTPLGEALRTGAPGSARATLLAFCSQWFERGFEEMLYSVQTGKTGFEKAVGMPVFEYLARTVSFMYFVHGGLCLFLSSDVRRFGPVITFVASIQLAFAAVVGWIDEKAGMPRAWTVAECGLVTLFSATILCLRLCCARGERE